MIDFQDFNAEITILLLVVKCIHFLTARARHNHFLGALDFEQYF